VRFEQVMAVVCGTPWAIRPDKLQAIEALIARKLAGDAAPPEVLAAAVAAKRGPGAGRSPKGVGLIPLFGTMTQRADLLTEFSGGTSCEAVGRQVDAYVADPAVDVIVLDIDSPGGSVYGVAELADKVHAAAKAKRVVAVADSEAASAAYWVAAQASELVVTPGGQVGSVGVYTAHVDVGEALKRDGRTVTLVSAGDLKTAGHRYGPLSDADRAVIQKGVDDYYDQFVRAVARGRRATLTAVRAGFGRGDMVRAQEAVREGLADTVAPLDEILARYGVVPPATPPAAALAAAAGPGADAAVEIRRRRLRLG